MIKKIVSAVLSLAVVASMAGISAWAESIKGDIDGSGKIDIEDVANVMNHINGVNSLSDEGLAAADLNSDGSVDIEDAVVMINTINGIMPDPSDIVKYDREFFSFKAMPEWEVSDEDGEVYLTSSYSDDGSCLIGIYTISYVGITSANIRSYSDKYIKDLIKDDEIFSGMEKEPEKINIDGEVGCMYKGKLYFESKYFDAQFAFVPKNNNIIVIYSICDYDTCSILRPKIQKVLDSITFK